MPDDSKQFERAVGWWEEMHNSKAYSLPSEVGGLAVICSYYTDFNNDSTDRVSKQSLRDIKKFRNEGLKIAELAQKQGKQAEAILNANAIDVGNVLRDPTISDVVVIGHGCLSSVYMKDPRSADTLYDWYDVALDTDHLKTGVFTQRFCGGLRRKLPVPLGTFAMADHRNVLAPIGLYFASKGLDYYRNDHLVPVSETKGLNIAQVKDYCIPGDD